MIQSYFLICIWTKKFLHVGHKANPNTRAIVYPDEYSMNTLEKFFQEHEGMNLRFISGSELDKIVDESWREVQG